MTRPLETLNSSASSATAKGAPPPFDTAANVESDFVVILSALLCALICVVGLIAVARCAWLRRATGAGRIPRPPPSANKGVKKKVLQSLPKFTYNDSSAAASKFAAECAICLGEFGEGEELRVLPQCGHAFHVVCIDTWLGSHSSCPSCRQVLGAARCQRCGGIPAAACGSGSMATEAELKGREDVEEGSGRNSDGGFLP